MLAQGILQQAWARLGLTIKARDGKIRLRQIPLKNTLVHWRCAHNSADTSTHVSELEVCVIHWRYAHKCANTSTHVCLLPDWEKGVSFFGNCVGVQNACKIRSIVLRDGLRSIIFPIWDNNIYGDYVLNRKIGLFPPLEWSRGGTSIVSSSKAWAWSQSYPEERKISGLVGPRYEKLDQAFWGARTQAQSSKFVNWCLVPEKTWILIEKCFKLMEEILGEVNNQCASTLL